ncbi:hypothetical protein DH2020_041029 [Rehmannia glutinosa]|uniref:Uncharacterized protein n=1 Tax=Rehmannia glutinosa TaxID=99300 RepID=A0ABR0URC4_REHGL
MIKRRFYRFEHGNRDDPSGSSSSSSDSEVEGEALDETEVEEDEEEEEEQDEEEENISSGVRGKGEASSSSGYESEDSSANEVNLDSSGLPTSDDDVAAQNGGQNIIGSFPSGEGDTVLAKAQHSPEKDEAHFDVADCVLKCKSVFKCKLCPRIVCLSEETLKAHLNSKASKYLLLLNIRSAFNAYPEFSHRESFILAFLPIFILLSVVRHARSEKLLKEGRLKLMLNDDGKIEGEAHTENHATTIVSGQKSARPKKKGKGPWKQRKRSRQDTKLGKERSSRDKRRRDRRMIAEDYNHVVHFCP